MSSKAHPAPPASRSPTPAPAGRRGAKSAQSTTPATTPAAQSELRIDGHLIEQQILARESGVSKSLISRMFSAKRGQRRRDPKLSTLLGLQRGLGKITGKDYSLDFIGQLIRL